MNKLIMSAAVLLSVATAALALTHREALRAERSAANVPVVTANR